MAKDEPIGGMVRDETPQSAGPHRVKVPQTDGQIVFFDGEQTIYKVNDGEINVAGEHLVRLLAGVPGASLVAEPESPEQNAEPEDLAKE